MEMCNSNRKYPSTQASTDGVGARQMELPLAPEGGEYLDNCSFSEAQLQGSEKSRRLFGELQEMGLPPVWRQIAARIGPESFLDIWQLLDGALSITDHRRVHVPHFSRFERYQRNLFIKSLAASDYSPKEIRSQLFGQGHYLSLKSITRIIQD